MKFQRFSLIQGMRVKLFKCLINFLANTFHRGQDRMSFWVRALFRKLRSSELNQILIIKESMFGSRELSIGSKLPLQVSRITNSESSRIRMYNSNYPTAFIGQTIWLAPAESSIVFFLLTTSLLVRTHRRGTRSRRCRWGSGGCKFNELFSSYCVSIDISRAIIFRILLWYSLESSSIGRVKFHSVILNFEPTLMLKMSFKDSYQIKIHWVTGRYRSTNRLKVCRAQLGNRRTQYPKPHHPKFFF